MSHQKTYAFWYYFVNEIPLTSSQIIEDIKVIQEVLWPGMYKLNDSPPDKKQGDQTKFFPKKTLEKEK